MELDGQGSMLPLFVAAMISFLFLPECFLYTETYFKQIFAYTQYKLPLKTEKRKKNKQKWDLRCYLCFCKGNKARTWHLMWSWICFAIVIFSELIKSGCGFYCKSAIVSLIEVNAQQCTLAGSSQVSGGIPVTFTLLTFMGCPGQFCRFSPCPSSSSSQEQWLCQEQ